jgi:hypothetical protein
MDFVVIYLMPYCFAYLNTQYESVILSIMLFVDLIETLLNKMKSLQF